MTSTTIDRVTGLTGNVAWKPPCVAATTANIALSGLQTIDSIVLAEFDRTLVMNQTDNTTNGIYIASSGAWQRAADFDDSRDAVNGTRVAVTGGSVNIGAYQLYTTDDTVVFGTTSIVFVPAGVAHNDLASTADAQGGTEAAKVMTPATTLVEINQFRPFSSNAQAVALSNDASDMTPLKVGAAVQANFADYQTVALVQAATIPAARLSLRTAGYYAAGDGGGELFKRAAVQSSGLGKTQSADGTWWQQAGPRFNVKAFGAKGDGTTDDTAAIQLALDAVKAFGGGTIYFPGSAGAYKITAGLTYDMSAAASRFDKRFRILGDGPAVSVISLVSVAATALTITGRATYPESWVDIEAIRITGDNTVGSKGIVLNICAFGKIEQTTVEAFDYNLDCTDTEQISLINSNFRWGIHGIRFNPVGSTTSPNNITIINCAISNNTTWGMQVTNGNAILVLGGSIQYNGTTGGGSTQWGAKFIECGDGYGTVVFDGVAVEGNGGVADVWTVNSTNTAAYTFRGCGFTRPNSTSYATSFVLIDGSTASKFAFSANTFRGYGTYVPNAARPYFTINNASAQIYSDGSNVWGSATEYPTWAAFGPFGSLVGTDVNYYVSGPFNKTDGITIGSLSDALSGLKPIELRTTDLSVSGITGVGSTNLKVFAGLQGTTTYDPPSLADGVGTTTTVTVTGAALGDTAIASFSLDTQGITITAWVSSANTVSVRFQNESGGTLDIASGTLKAMIIK